MAKLRDEIYLGRADYLGIDYEEYNFHDFEDALHSDIDGATEITVLGGYANTEWLEKLCLKLRKKQRTDCRVRIAIGLDNSAHIPELWCQLGDVRSKLMKKGFKDLTIAVAPSRPVHLHTKLFRIVHHTSPKWYVGSANPGSKRHELMLRFTGAHQALAEYVNCVFEKAIDVAGPQPGIFAGDLRSFFLTGTLCSKLTSSNRFTFDAFNFSPEARRQISDALAGSSGVSHASPKTEGFGFNLKSALELKGEFESESTPKARSQLKRWGIETALGLWVPTIYVSRLQSKNRKIENHNCAVLETLGEKLNSKTELMKAREGFKEHISSMEEFIQVNNIEAKKKQGLKEKFDRFLESRGKMLSDQMLTQRMSRTLTFMAMPYIWDDSNGDTEFEETFFDELAYRSRQMRSGMVWNSISKYLGDGDLLDGCEIRERFELTLAETPWESTFWNDA